VRPREEVFNINWDPREPGTWTNLAANANAMSVPVKVAQQKGWTPTSAEQARLRTHLAKAYNLQSLTSCSTCHR